MCKVLSWFCFILSEEPAQSLVSLAVLWLTVTVTVVSCSGFISPSGSALLLPFFPLTASHGTGYRAKKRTNHILWAFLMLLTPSGPLHQHPLVDHSP